MKSKIFYGFKCFVLMSLYVLTLSGCQKWSHNGDIDGQWQVMDVTYSGISIEFPEGERFYYSFYLHTFQLGFTDERPGWLKGNFSIDGDKLWLELPYTKHDDFSKIWAERLKYWGFPLTGEVTLHIRQLDSSRLVMEYDDVVITCRKF